MEKTSDINNLNKLPSNLKLKIFSLIDKMTKVEVLTIKTEKMKLKNTLINNSFNIFIKQEEEFGLDYRKIENLHNNLLNMKKKFKRGESFNISTNSMKLLPGQTLPLKFLYLNNKIYQLPRNKLNILMFISRDFNFENEKIKNLVTFLKNKFVSSIHISFYKTLTDGLFEYTEDFLSIKRQLGVSKLPYAIVYDSKLRVIMTGDLNDLNDEVTLHHILSSQNGIGENSIVGLVSQLDHLKSINDISGKTTNLNAIYEENLTQYKNLKSEMEKLNRSSMREMKCKLNHVEICLTKLKKYTISNNKETDHLSNKIIYKPSIAYNEKATIKDKTGKYIDNLILNYKSIMNFVNNEDLEDYHKYVKYGIEYFYNAILIPLNLVGKMKLGIKSEEKLGLCNIKLRYIIYNLTPFSEILELNTYYDVVLKAIDDYMLDYTNKELKDSVFIKTSYYPEKPGKMIVPCLDENKNEKWLEMVENEVQILFILSVFNPIFLQMFSSTLALIENIKRTSEGRKLPIINCIFVIMCPVEEMTKIMASKEYLELKRYIGVDEKSSIVFVDIDTQMFEWWDYHLGEELSAVIIGPKGEKISLSSDDLILMDTTLKFILHGTKTYNVDKNVFEELKDFGKKLVKVKLTDLEYNPFLYYRLTEFSELETNSNRQAEQKALNYTVSFICRLRRKDRGSMAPFIKKTLQIMKLEEDLEIYEELCDVTDIELGEICSECKKELKGLGELQFYCYWCKIHFCSDCGNLYHPEKNSNRDKLPHPHFLTLIKVQNQSGMKNIDTYKFGNNIWEKYQTSDSPLNCYDCIGCTQPCTTQLRYVCLSCRPGSLRGQEEECLDKGGFVDICCKCMELILNDEWKNDPKMGKRFDKENHDFNSHVYLRIDLPTGNYYFY